MTDRTPTDEIPTDGAPVTAAQRERRRRILAAAVALASDGGFDAVQMRTVAERADVALGTLYRYFPSKIHLLVTALGVEFERAAASLADGPVPGETPADRVGFVLAGATRTMQEDPRLAEALTRAFMFADASVTAEIHRVGRILTSMLTRAMGPQPGPADPGEDDVALARVIGDVWLAAMVGWVTGRTSTEEVSTQLSVAVRLLLR